MTRKERLNKLFKENDLLAEDVFKHKHFTIITRGGVDKIQAKNKIVVQYDVVRCEPNFAVVQATAVVELEDSIPIQTFGSALKGATYNEGNTNSWYVMEIAEKRAMSRAVLKLAGLYELGVMSEDESPEFKKSKNNQKVEL